MAMIVNNKILQYWYFQDITIYRQNENIAQPYSGKFHYFSTLNFASGYWQIQVHPEKTAFITPQELYQIQGYVYWAN